MVRFPSALHGEPKSAFETGTSGMARVIRLVTGFTGAGILLSLPVVSLAEEAADQRWYTSERVEQGAKVYAQHCASCHGLRAEATPDWQTSDADGRYPPPPLNGTAHTWHHPLPVLRRIVREGGTPLGGLMPAFGDQLGADEVDAVIAWFQSLWPSEIYAAWGRRNHEAGRVRSTLPHPGDKGSGFPVLTTLRRQLPGTTIGPPTPTPVRGVNQVKVGRDYVYLSGDGRYLFTGDLVDLVSRENLTAQVKERDRLTELAGVPETDMVIFPADNEERAKITVFTDVTCPYCQRLHREVPALLSAGVTVRYLALPRSGPQGPRAREIRAVWCAEDRLAAMDVAKGVRAGKLGDSNCRAAEAVERGYRLGRALGIQGTPAVVLADGSLVPGYRPASKLLQALGLTSDDDRQATGR